MIGEATAQAVPSTAQSRSPQQSRTKLIRKVAVLGAGTMGSRIAAHIANAGTPVVLLDIVPAGAQPGNHAARSALAHNAVEAMRKAKPAAFFDNTVARLVTTGNFEDDLKLLADCDWIIEAVAENLEIKRSLLRNVDAVRRPDAIVTTNTSGLPVAQIAEGMPEAFRRNWFGTHFFNPPRYMPLLEIISTPETDPAAIEAVEQFGHKHLGKTIVEAKDTPNFIANRIGTFALMNGIRIMQEMDLTIEQVDALTGSVLGWPKTGTFRLADMVGLDVLGHVAANFLARVRDERPDVRAARLHAPDARKQVARRQDGTGLLPQAARRRRQGAAPRPGLEDARIPSIRNARTSRRSRWPRTSIPSRSASGCVLANDPRKDTAAAFHWRVLPELWNYAANRIPEISNDIVGIDAAMRAGFNWELGPFELWDAAGVAGDRSADEGRRNAGRTRRRETAGQRL